MKIWTVAWFESGNDTSKEYKRLWQLHHEHLERLRGSLPDHLFDLANLRGIDASLITRVEHDTDRNILTLVLTGGDSGTGLYDLVLRYENPDITPEHKQTLSEIADAINTVQSGSDLARHELDVTETGQIEHRLLFHGSPYYSTGYKWFAVRADALTWETIPNA